MVNIFRMLSLGLIISLGISCLQRKEKINLETKKEMLEKIDLLLNSFDAKPVYGINFSNTESTCQFEILINDLPLFKFLNQRGGLNTYIPINPNILKSGKQKMTLKLYPSVTKDKLVVYYKKNSPFELSISVGVTGKDGVLEREEIIYTLPFIPLPEKGLPYWETELEFEAEVPYKFIGWSESKDLTKVTDIEDKVLEKYRELQKIIEDKDFQLFYNISQKKEMEVCTALYLKQSEIDERVKELKETFTERNAKFQIKKDIIVKFYGDGRLVTLESSKDGSSALSTIIKEETGNETINFPVYLHIPQGSEALEVIR